MEHIIKRVKYIAGIAFLLFPLYILLIMITSTFGGNLFFGEYNIVCNLTMIGSLSLAGTLCISSAQKDYKKKCNIMHCFVILVAIAYFLGVFITLLSNSSLLRDHCSGQITYKYNLIPFATIWDFISKGIHHDINLDIVIINLTGNTIMFLPMTVILPLLFGQEKGLRKYFFVTLGIIIVAEIVQLLTRAGSFDVDDILLNAVGAFLGILLYKAKSVQFILKKLYMIPRE